MTWREAARQCAAIVLSVAIGILLGVLTSTPQPPSVGSRESNLSVTPQEIHRQIGETRVWGTVPDWIGIVVTLAAVIAAFITLDKLERQTKATEDAAKAAIDSAAAAKVSADAIKVIHRQWLHVGDWQVSRGILGTTGDLQVRVSAWVKNKTELPLFVRTMRGTIGLKKASHEWVNAEVMPGTGIQLSIDCLYRGQERVAFEAAPPSLAVQGWVHFFDAFGDEQRQPFGAYIDYSAGGLNPLVRGLAGLNKSLAKLAAEWPLDEPTQYTQWKPSST